MGYTAALFYLQCCKEVALFANTCPDVTDTSEWPAIMSKYYKHSNESRLIVMI